LIGCLLISATNGSSFILFYLIGDNVTSSSFSHCFKMIAIVITL